MNKGIDAGPFQSPYRFRNLTWTVDDKMYCWERPISSQQAGFVMVAQCRNWLPDPIGGIYWFTPDDAYTTAFTPLYCGMTKLPKYYDRGDHNRFSWDSAWWVFNFVSNYCYDRWNRVFPDVKTVRDEHENLFLQLTPAIDEHASELYEKSPALARKFLTDYSTGTAEELFEDWKELSIYLLTRHNDGYLNSFDGEEPKGIGYAEEWLKRVIDEKGDQFYVGPAREDH
jgi:dipeptidase